MSLAGAILSATAPVQAGEGEGETATRSTVVSHVVELFTSQGCSSCPPAEEILTDLVADSSILALAYHVDYWDYIGWRDIYGSPENTARQKAYRDSFNLPSLYTPQLVVDGRRQLVGADEDAVKSTLASLPSLASETDGWVRLERAGEHVKITAQLNNPMVGGPLPVLILVTYDEEGRTTISRGENSGRTLVETQPVRGWRILGMWSGEPLKISLPVATLTEGARGKNGCAALIQAMSADGSPGPILAAARLDLPED